MMYTDLFGVGEKFAGRDCEIMQFTGLKDKNGREIFEGDVVLIPDTDTVQITDDGQGPVEDSNHLAPVVFEKAMFGVNIQDNLDCYKKGFYSFESMEYTNITDANELEIIGNIYENPELLK